MIAPKKYKKEGKRIKKLKSYFILDTLSEVEYDNLTLLAAEICGTPISLISFIDDERQWFKSSFGLEVKETPLEYSFCAHAINDPNEIFIVADSRKDERFYNNPFVTEEPNIVFYAGVPLITDNGLPLGTLCVADQKPRELTPKQLTALKALSNQVLSLLELRLSKIELEKRMNELEEKNIELEKFAYIAAHDLKSPLGNIAGLAEIFAVNYSNSIDIEGKEILNLISSSTTKLREMIDGLLEYTKSDKNLNENKTDVILQVLDEEIKKLFVFKNNISIKLKSNLNSIRVNKTAIEQVLINLVANAIKYNDKDVTEIKIKITENKDFYKISVKDNGPGILEENYERIFRLFEVLTAEDRFGENGNGIGLATVKKIVEYLGGTIHVESKMKKGSKFVFTISKV